MCTQCIVVALPTAPVEGSIQLIRQDVSYSVILESHSRSCDRQLKVKRRIGKSYLRRRKPRVCKVLLPLLHYQLQRHCFCEKWGFRQSPELTKTKIVTFLGVLNVIPFTVNANKHCVKLREIGL